MKWDLLFESERGARQLYSGAPAPILKLVVSYIITQKGIFVGIQGMRVY